MVSFPAPLVASPRQHCAISQVLLAQVVSRRWKFIDQSRQWVKPAMAVARDGFLPALMAGAVWECRVPLEALSKQQFVGIEEPTPYWFPCGFYLGSNPRPHQWVFPLLAHMEAHASDGVIDLEPAWTAWSEGIKGTLQHATFRLPLVLLPGQAA